MEKHSHSAKFKKRILPVMKTLLINSSLLALGMSGFFGATASDSDKAFVAKVSQGGAYEVAASKLAETRAHAQDVRDQAITEVHDHTLVGAKLKQISAAGGVAIAPVLNAEFTARLAKLKATGAADFDAAYIEDMKQIHDKDEKLFAQESNNGSGAFKTFAAETDLIVKRHIGSLHGTDR